jgi:prophage regulatory protein
MALIALGPPSARQNKSLHYSAGDPLPTHSDYRFLSSSIPTSKAKSMSRTESTLSKRTIRRHQLREMVPLADTTIYEMEQRGEFPLRFYLTTRCVVWDLAEVEAWIEARRHASKAKSLKLAPSPDVHLRKARPVKH